MRGVSRSYPERCRQNASGGSAYIPRNALLRVSSSNSLNLSCSTSTHLIHLYGQWRAWGVELATRNLHQTRWSSPPASSTVYPRPRPRTASATGTFPPPSSPPPFMPTPLPHFPTRNLDLQGMLHMLAVAGWAGGCMMPLERKFRSRPGAPSATASIDRACSPPGAPNDRKRPLTRRRGVRLLLGGRRERRVGAGRERRWGEKLRRRQ